ncbi:MAG TPA: RiPP maturation radical SAM C-methyltransferase [Ilumatobacteraceae bacterium]|nr:RiPP maturation radical SAM C-methyltransferase [Ilumatobacteraceae bacterium]
MLLVSMPYGALERPALGLGLLKAGVQRAGFHCDVRYLTFRFAEFIGIADYQWFVTEAPYTAFAGDWSFTHALHGPWPQGDEAYVRDVLRGTWHLDDATVDMVLRTRHYVEPFLDHCIETIPFGHYDVVGFTSTFEQNIASLALAKRIKDRYPHVRTAFGGANWEGAMGVALHECYPFVDLAFSGEADISLPAALRALAGGRPLTEVAGVVARDPVRGSSIATGAPERVDDLDGLPHPDFSDYFDTKDQTAGADEVTPVLILETARGCWWGARSHCTFCGLNGEAMAYRSKSPARAVDELDTITERYGIDRVHMVDNIIDMRYFRTVLPALAARRRKLSLFYEVKANLSHAQVRALAEAGVTEIQPGIESMSDHVLDLMRKGTTALRNVALLKWCREFGVQADWNLLYGFPGETVADYAAILDLLISIDHLQAPGACGPIRLDRFSPYHNDPASFGMTNVRPLMPYQYVYPTAGNRLMDIACYFDFDLVSGRPPDHVARPVIDYWHRRRLDPAQGNFWLLAPTNNPSERVVLIDERTATRRTAALEGWQAAVYHGCDRAQDTSSVIAIASEVDPTVSANDVMQFVTRMEHDRWMLGRADHHLSLAVHSPARWASTPSSPRLHRMLAVSGP